MEYRRLGRTGLPVSAVGLGTGGASRLGQLSGVPQTEAVRVVQRALDLGVNLIDTATVYDDSEAILGRALQHVPRDRFFLATKFFDYRGESGLQPAGALTQSLERSLQRLGLDYVDVFQLHGVPPDLYRQVVERYLPEARRCQEQGKFRFLGITETFSGDRMHDTLSMALADDHFDTIMVGYNLLALGAERHVLPQAQRRDVGVFAMVAVSRALSRPERLLQSIADLKARGGIAREAVPDDDPLGWLVHDGVTSLPSAAYKFVAEHQAVSSVLTGTANVKHLEDNVRSILGPPLPAGDRARVVATFGHIKEAAR